MHSQRFHANSSFAAAIIGVLIAIALAGCAAGGSEGAGYSAAPPPAATPPPAAATAASEASAQAQKGVVGVWEGTTLAYCGMSLPSRCNAEQNVTMTVIEGENSKLGGFYKCSYGNLNCYNMNTTGKIGYAKVAGTQISMIVMMPDGTSCRFNGRNDNGNVTGGYSCSSGGAPFEQGTWRARRSY